MTDKRPLISVIVPFHNNEGDLAASLESIATQSYDHIEVIMVERPKAGDVLALEKLDAVMGWIEDHRPAP